MKPYLLALSCILGVACAHSQLPPASYVGYLTLPDATYYMQIDHSVDTTQMQIPELLAEGHWIASWEDDGFTVVHQFTNWRFFHIQAEENGFSGQLDRAGLGGHFRLFPVAEATTWEPEDYTHAYRLPNGEYVNIWAPSDQLRMHAALSGKVSRLQPIGEHQFYSNAGELVTFAAPSADGFRQMTYQYLGGAVVQATYEEGFEIQRQEVVILGDTVGLSLYLPVGEEASPACIIPMGAARYERWIYALEARILATHGIATLIYDNYGTGASSGTFGDKTFADKKDQLLALYDWLAKQPGIAPDKIGFRGGSQGGRLSLMAAAEQGRTAFVIALSAPMETRLDQQLYALSLHHRKATYPEDVIARNTEVWRRYFNAVVAGEVANDLVKDATVLRSAYPEMYLPAVEQDQVPQLPWAADLTDSGTTYLQDIDCPILALYGALDDRVPAQKSAAILRRGLQSAGKAPPTIIIYDNANHSFLLPGHRIVPGLFMDQIRFIKKLFE